MSRLRVLNCVFSSLDVSVSIHHEKGGFLILQWFLPLLIPLSAAVVIDPKGGRFGLQIDRGIQSSQRDT